MMAMQDVCTSFRFSTDGLPEAARAKAVRELYERTRIEPLEALPDCVVRVDIVKFALPGLGAMSGVLSGLRQAARPRGSASSEDDLFLGVNLRWSSIGQQCDQELILQDGDAVLAIRGLTGFTVTRPAPVRFFGFRIPREAIAPLIGRLDDAPIRVVPHRSEALCLLVTYAGAIAGEQPLDTPELQRLVVTDIHDLIAATIGATRDAKAIAEGRGVRAARLRAIIGDINANLGNCDLTVAAVARRQRVTPRYVHKLFEGEGLTFSAFVLGRRLARAHRMLRDPRFADRSISSVAFDVGFGDLSYFNRAFRRCYEATPSENQAIGDIETFVGAYRILQDETGGRSI
jgi:AraC-like DNA-binding protein